ncbi:unnamed protein product [Chrysodeixis includens]|uniref:N(4)-(beta-N-acetylglucosaminyl)-L-asparaginase n=1 Tax=Chrysodeixis includens TaxID=689277 RepID=A0A9P0FYA7_CHRIL|nr:unnamed protein product [Chrysodeixis includens]
MLLHLFIVFSFSFKFSFAFCEVNTPVVITTWAFTNATTKAWDVLKVGGKALDAIEQGISVCEEMQCDGTVGYGGSPDENGETTLDALLMDGKTMNVGAVGALRKIKNAVSVARRVLDHTKHSILVGDQATEFAVQMGFKEENLTTDESKELWEDWKKEKKCQPNFWINVDPDPKKQCGPYKDKKAAETTTTTTTTTTETTEKSSEKAKDEKKTRFEETYFDKDYTPKVHMLVNRYNHDTIGMVATDSDGNLAAGTSTNGAKFKIPGRIGDSPIPGAGAYVDNDIGGAAATGDGDIMLRFLPSFAAVEAMRRGAGPENAARIAIRKIANYYPDFMGAVIALAKSGQHGAACHGLKTFPYVVQDDTRKTCQIIVVNCDSNCCP